MSTNLENTIRGTRENLLEQVPIERATRPIGFYKSITLDFLTVASAVWVSYACRNFLENGAVLNFAIAIFPFLILSSLEVILTDSLFRRFCIIVIETVALSSFFYAYPKTYLFSASSIFLVLLIWGEISSRSEILNSLEIKFIKFTAPLFKKMITALILFTIILYVPQWDNKSVFISQRTFGGVFVWTTGFIHNFYPEINFDSTVDDLAKEITHYQLAGTHPYEDLPAAVQENLLKQFQIQIDDQLKKFLGGDLTGKEKVGDVVYKLILNSLNSWRERFGSWFVITWIASVFLAARLIGTVIWWLSALISLLIYQLLVALNFIAIRGESTTKESLVFS